MDERGLRNLLPETLELELNGHKIFLTHGMEGQNMIIRRLNKQFDLSPHDIIILGYVHRSYNECGKDGKLYLNPGTPTDRTFTNINLYGFLRISEEKLEPEIRYL